MKVLENERYVLIILCENICGNFLRDKVLNVCCTISLTMQPAAGLPSRQLRFVITRQMTYNS